MPVTSGLTNNTSQVSPSGWGLRGRRGYGANRDDVRVILQCGGQRFTYTSSPYTSWNETQWYPEFLSRYHNNGSVFLFVSTNSKWVEDRGSRWAYRHDNPANTDVLWF